MPIRSLPWRLAIGCALALASAVPAAAAPVADPPASDAAANAARVREAFAAWRDGRGSVFDLLHEDVEWTVAGTSPVSGVYRSRAQFLEQAVAPIGARLATPLPGHDVDLFDDFCEHLLVREEASGRVIGTYRVLTPAQARRVGGTYSDTEFDLTRLRSLRTRMVELGRSCVHRDHRQGGVILALWGALADFMHRNRLDTMIGCASIPMNWHGAACGDAAASIWRQVSATHMAPIEYQVQPRLPLPVDRLDGTLPVEPPALIRGYLRLGARVLGAPAWDPDFNTADLPMLLRIADLPPRWRRQFGAA